MDWIVKVIVVLCCGFTFYNLLSLYRRTEKEMMTRGKKGRLLLTGFFASCADTLGLGSFAVIVTINSRIALIEEKQLPGSLNAQCVLPSMLQSLLFLHFVEIETFTLVSLLLSACLGAASSGMIVSRLDSRSTRMVMGAAFFLFALILLAAQLQLLPFDGNEHTLSSKKLAIALVAIFFAGMLPAIGVGIFIPIQVILFLLDLSPLVAFPIMTTIAAIVQSVTAYTFVINEEVALKESLLMSVAGLAGVVVAAPLITFVETSTLRWLLFAILLYNSFMVWSHFQKEKKAALST